MKCAIITEKADVARRISFFLSEGKAKSKRSKGHNYIEFEKDGNTYVVVPLSGHIVEINFPPSMKDWKSVDLRKLVESETVIEVKNRSAYSTLKDIAADADQIIIATDYDREGELIGMEALNIVLEERQRRHLGMPDIKRAKFSALTRQEVTEAFSNLIDVNKAMADSAEAREVIDLLWGAVLTRFFSNATGRWGRDFLSIGRVQTPTLALIVKREREILSFVPEKFWRVFVSFDKGGTFRAEHVEGNIKDHRRVEEILSKVRGKDGRVRSFERWEEPIRRPAPFNTNEFLREASRIGISPANAMRIAESLYNRGYISYPRTDNTVYNRSLPLRKIVESLAETQFSREANMVLSLDSVRPSRGRTEATDHPPIYPASAAKKGELTGDYAKIYELVVRRFLATLYTDGTREVREATIEVSGEEFRARGVRVTEPGWLSIYTYHRQAEAFLPDLHSGEEVKAIDWYEEEDETKPPPRYDMSSLLRKMEELNLGTKSTRHDIIEKLQKRGFIEGNPVRPTPLGMSLIDSILTVESKISEPEMTAELEVDMDRIAENKVDKESVVNQSRKMLSSVLEDFREKEDIINGKIKEAENSGETVGLCPVHSREVIAIKKRDHYEIRCTVEGCPINYRLYARGSIKKTDERCSACSKPLIKVIRKGQSPELRCIDPACAFNVERSRMGKCPSDGGDLVVRQSRNGKRFLSCSNYPKCTVSYPLPQMGTVEPTGQVCQYCGAPILLSIRGRRRWRFCPKMDCQFNRRRGDEEPAS